MILVLSRISQQFELFTLSFALVQNLEFSATVFQNLTSNLVLVVVPSNDSQYLLRDEAHTLDGFNVEVAEDLLQQRDIAEDAVHRGHDDYICKCKILKLNSVK